MLGAGVTSGEVRALELDDVVVSGGRGKDIPWKLRVKGFVETVTLAQAAQENPTAIASTAGAFFMVAVRRDLLLAPRSEHKAILAQARRFSTMGEVGVYCRRVITEIARQRGNSLGRKPQPVPAESR